MTSPALRITEDVLLVAMSIELEPAPNVPSTVAVVPATVELVSEIDGRTMSNEFSGPCA